MTDVWKMALSVLVLIVLVLFAVEAYFFITHGHFLPVRDIFRVYFWR